MSTTGLTTKNIALVAIFAALYYVLSLFTFNISAPGVSQVQISLFALAASVFGLVLGPYLGTLAAFLGTLVAWTLPPSGMSPYGFPFILSPTLNAFVTGSIFYKKWKAGFLAFAVLIAAFFFTPPVQPLAENLTIVAAVLADKIFALLLIIPLVRFKDQFVSSEKGIYAFYLILGFIGNQADNMWGTLAFSVPTVYNGIFGLPLEAVRTAFLISPFFYPVLRLIQASAVMFIAVALMRTLKGTPWLWQKETILSI
ncbi:MAG: ECF transporter S component [Candidatus Bathyarchaeia archaeon]